MKFNPMKVLWILFLYGFVLGCQIDSDEIPQALEAKSYAFSIEDMPELGNVLAPYLGRVSRNNENKPEVNGGYNSLVDRINFKHILARMDSTGQTYMSMSILNDDPHVIQNLVIGKDVSGKYLNPMIFTYTMSEDFYAQYQETLSLEGFKGNFERVNLNPYALKENNSAANLENQRSATSTDCPDGTPLEPQANPDPLDPNPTNNDGSSGGTSTVSNCSYELQIIGYITTETTNRATGEVWTQTYPQWGMVLVCPGGPNQMSSSDTSCTDPNSGEVPIVIQKPKMNCNDLRNTHGDENKDNTIWTFYYANRHKTYDEIINQRPPGSFMNFGSQPGGPDVRYIKDPLSDQTFIDLRHMLIMGKKGRAIGNGTEVVQWIAGKPSAFDDQDYYSNELGYAFFEQYGQAIKYNPSDLVEHLLTFLNDLSKRNALTNPKRCDF